MKKGYSWDVYKFRWEHYKLVDKVIDIAIYALGCLMVMFGIVDVIFRFDYVSTPISVMISVAVLIVVVALMMVDIYRQGCFDQKYLKELNEIRVRLGRKPSKGVYDA